jgi:hypothetical protein
VLVLGEVGINKATEWALAECGPRVRLEGNQVTVDGRSYAGPEIAFLISCRRSDYPEHIVTVFAGVTTPAAAKVARLLFFYGWQSYIIFRDGTVIDRGDFPSEHADLEVRLAS